jgi:hypothetical protein
MPLLVFQVAAHCASLDAEVLQLLGILSLSPQPQLIDIHLLLGQPVNHPNQQFLVQSVQAKLLWMKSHGFIFDALIEKSPDTRARRSVPTGSDRTGHSSHARNNAGVEVTEIREERQHPHRDPPQERRNWMSGRRSPRRGGAGRRRPRRSTSGTGSLRDSMGSEKFRVSHEFRLHLARDIDHPRIHDENGAGIKISARQVEMGMAAGRDSQGSGRWNWRCRR